MSTNVKFLFTNDLSKYTALETKDQYALYFIEDTATGYKALYKGENLIAVGNKASATLDGLMSKEDKAKLDAITASGETTELTALDTSIVISEGKIGVALSAVEGNAIVLKSDGLFVETPTDVEVPEYSIEKQTIADEGFNATYKLKKTVNGETSYVGDAINVAIDAVLSSAEFKTVTETDIPYSGAVIGDPYIELGFNDDSKTHLYVPMKGLVDQYTAGDGIKIENNVVSINLGSTTNGLHFVDGTLNLALATKDTAGALSAVDKAFIDSIPTTYATKAELDELKDQITWREL